MFSVIIPLYNKEVEIKNTLNSVLSQTYKYFEVIIVNDGSTDTSLKVANSFNDDRIKIIDQKNGGVSLARNKGIKEANYKWIAFLDADDLWEPNHLEVLSKAINKYNEYSVFCTSYIRTGQDLPSLNNQSVTIISDYYKKVLEEGHFFWTSVVCINKDVFDKIGYFRVDLSRGEDLELWSRIADVFKIVKLNLVTAEYVLYSQNKLTKTSVNKFNNSILNNIEFDSLEGNKKKYFKYLILKKIKETILNKNWSQFFKIIYKYHVNII